MSRYSADHVPTYRLHKQSGRAAVTIAKRQHLLDGAYDSAESRKHYNRLIAEWFAAGRPSQTFVAEENLPAPCVTVDDVLAAFWMHAQAYYRDRQGEPSGEQKSYFYVIKIIHRLYGSTPAAEFDQLALQACQAAMIKDGWSRKNINRQVIRIRHVFKWALSKKMVPAGIVEALQSVTGLKKGRSEAKERPPIKAAAIAHVQAIMAHANRFIAAMVELQMVSGMRSGELVIMRTGDIDREGETWAYRPSKHKGQHHEHDRIIYLGRRAQAIIKPFLKLDPAAYLFSPSEAREEFLAGLTANRKTPLKWGNRIGTNRKARPKKKPGQFYQVMSYCHALATACKRAFPAPANATPDEAKQWHKQHHIHPHQLRHTAGTRFRRDANIETAKALLGQRTIQAAEIYAEQDMERARKFVEAAG